MNISSRNFYLLSLIKVSHWFMLVMPIIVLFYQSNHLSMHEIFILQSIYSISIVVFEIPSGYIADVIGRKKTILIGAWLGLLGYIIYSFTEGFWSFVFAEITLGIGQSMISGADSAMLYDSLRDDQNEKAYLKLEGRIISIGNFAEAIAGIIGGLLAIYSLRYPYYGQVIISAIAIPAAILLKEPHCSNIRIALGWKQIFNVVKYSIKTQVLFWNILYSSFIGVSTLTMAWFVQPWFIMNTVPAAYFGILWTLLNLTVGIASLFSYKIQHTFGEKKVHLFFNFIIIIGFLALGWLPFWSGIILLFIFYIARGIATPILKNNINQFTPSNIRATVLSIRNFFIRIVFSVVGPILGYLSDKLSLKYSLTIGGIILGFVIILSFIFFLKNIYLKLTKEVFEY
ncbi:MAG: MFS transporter [Bacteroidales bacterium]|nr:MFS transporter [Bacteroidales bacterium]